MDTLLQESCCRCCLCLLATACCLEDCGNTTSRQSDTSSPHLAAEVAEELGVLADLHLLDLLTETRSVASPVLAHDAHLLRALGLRQTQAPRVQYALAPEHALLAASAAA
jgi:hypothetical protein